MRPARGDAMIDFRSQIFDRPLVGPMIITINSGKRLALQSYFKKLPHVLFHSFGIRTTKFQLQLPAPTFLVRGHPAFAAQLAVREIDQEIRSLLNGQVVVDGEILAELEGLESIGDDFVDRWALFHHLVMEEQTMTAQAGDVSVDGLRRYLQIPGNLSVGHSSGGFHDDLGIEIGALLPVGCGEGL